MIELGFNLQSGVPSALGGPCSGQLVSEVANEYKAGTRIRHFRILVLKSTLVSPNTSPFLELDCGC
jgi:hypothetical protein